VAFLVLGALTLTLSYAVLRDGGVEPPDWRACLSAIGVVSVLCFAPSRRVPLRPPDPKVRLLFLVLLAVAVVQVLPLPVAAIRILSPARAEMLAGSEPVLGKWTLAPLSTTPAAGLEQLLSLIGCAMVFLLVADLGARMRERPWLLVLPLIVIAFLEAILGLVQAYAAGGDVVARGTYVNRNHFAGFLEMCLPFAVVWPVWVLRRSYSPRTTPARPALIACAGWAVAAVILLAIIHSLSRMGFFATLLSLLVLGLVALGTGRRRFRHWWLPAGLLTVVVSLAFVFLPPDRLIFRIAKIASTDAITADTRLQIWQETIRLIGAYPLVGCGVGGYESCMMRYQTTAHGYTVDFAHNDYLQVAAEQGIPGLLIWLALGALVTRSLWKVISRTTWREERYRSLACLGALAAISLHSLVDFNLHIPANAMTLAWIGGVAHCAPENH